MGGRRVLVAGNCAKDHRAIQSLLEQHFCAVVERADTCADVEQALAGARYGLVLVNREFFADGSDGVALIGKIRCDTRLDQTPAMLISNFAEAQEAAIASGAAAGFGKAAMTAPETIKRLAQYLPRRASADAH